MSTPAAATRPSQSNASDPRTTKNDYRYGSYHTRSGNRHRPKRSRQPRNFIEWTEEDQDKFKKTTLNLRNWKAAQRQSQYLRMRTGRLQKFKLFFKRSPEHKKELEVYAKTKKSWKFVPANEQLDLPPIQ
ncbi:hypothetical protein M3Y95_00983300 [Aphelenchoides besseyi]|nr:hypothetical protein M3Y95_00983300 [Aphelenchoides besseyi]